MDKYKCKACGYVYDPKKGDSKKGVEPEYPSRIWTINGYVLNVMPRKTGSRNIFN
jgi:hypothetical protein